TIARWDGWEASSLSGPHEHFHGLEAILSIAEPRGMLPAGLYAGGDITLAGGAPVNRFARPADGAWHDVEGGVTRPGRPIPYFYAMQVFDEDGDGPLSPSLFAGGSFEHAGGVAAHALARWNGHEWSAVGGGLETSHVTTHATVRAMAIYDDGRGPA